MQAACDAWRVGACARALACVLPVAVAFVQGSCRHTSECAIAAAATAGGGGGGVVCACVCARTFVLGGLTRCWCRPQTKPGLLNSEQLVATVQLILQVAMADNISGGSRCRCLALLQSVVSCPL